MHVLVRHGENVAVKVKGADSSVVMNRMGQLEKEMKAEMKQVIETQQVELQRMENELKTVLAKEVKAIVDKQQADFSALSKQLQAIEVLLTKQTSGFGFTETN